MCVTPLVAAALSDTKAGLPVKNGSITTAALPKSRRKAEWPYQVICMLCSCARGRCGRSEAGVGVHWPPRSDKTYRIGAEASTLTTSPLISGARFATLAIRRCTVNRGLENEQV